MVKSYQVNIGPINLINRTSLTAIPKLSSLYESSLVSRLSPVGTTFDLVDPTDDNGDQLAGLYGFRIDDEFLIGTIVAGVVTVVIRNCDPDNPLVQKTGDVPDHRRGRPVKITDYPILAYLRELADGNYSFPNKLKYATDLAFTDDKELVPKKYVDDGLNNGSGNPNASATTKGITKLSLAPVSPTNPIAVGDNDTRLPAPGALANLPTANEKAAMAAGGDFGAASGSNKYLTQDYNKSTAGLPVVRVYGQLSGDSTSQFDITNPAGTTFRYTWDGAGTNPNISAVTAAVGYKVNVFLPGSAVNSGSFTITGSGANYFEVTNASGAVAPNELIGTGYLQIYNPTWTKPATLKYAVAETGGAGAGGGGTTTISTYKGGGGGGGYSRKLIAAASAGATETIAIGNGGLAGPGTGGAGGNGGTSSFGSILSATGGTGGDDDGGAGGIGIGGDLNIAGQGGGAGSGPCGAGGSSFFGGGAQGVTGSAGKHGRSFGGGGGGGGSSGGADTEGGHGFAGMVVVTEYYS
jgi:hypothetical protein